MMVAPGFNSPRASASSIMAAATRSFALPAGFSDSSFASTRAASPSAASVCVNSKSGVCPISCSMDV